MPITRADAQQALADIHKTETRGIDAKSYRAGGSALILWGGVWLAAYTATGLLPAQDWWIAWVPGNLAGALGTFALYRNKPPGKRSPAYWAIPLAAICLLTALTLIAPPHTAQQAEALPALIVAFLYMVLGSIRLPRYIAIGATLFAATLLGFYALPHLFAFWMAAIGGGALALGGVWLRRA